MAKKIGIFCGIYPVEIIESFDLLWEFVVNTEAKDLWEQDIVSYICEYCKKQIDFLSLQRASEYEAFFLQTHCDGMDRLYDVYRVHQAKAYLFQNPRDYGDAGKKFYKIQLQNIIKYFENITGQQYSPHKLRKAIERSKSRRHVFNSIKRYISLGLFEATAYEHYLNLIISGALTEIKDTEINNFIMKIDELINKFNFKGNKKNKILVVGAIVHNYELLHILEKKECIAIPIFYNLTPYDGQFNSQKNYDDPLDELTDFYITHVRNNRSNNNIIYYEYLQSCIEKYNVNAVIFFNNKFCTINSFDTDNILPFLKDKDIPVLAIEDSFESQINAGVVNRINAFIEII